MQIDDIIEKQMKLRPGVFPSDPSWKGSIVTILIAIITNAFGMYIASSPITHNSYFVMVLFALNATWAIIIIIVIKLSVVRIIKKNNLIPTC